MDNQEIKGLSLAEFSKIKIDVTSAMFFEAVNFIKSICKLLNVEYNSLFEPSELSDTFNKIANVPALLAKLADIFSEEYKAVNEFKQKNEPKEHGPLFQEYISVIAAATEKPFEVIEKTAPKLLLELFMRIIFDPAMGFDDTFFLKKILKSLFMIEEYLSIAAENQRIQTSEIRNALT